MSDNPIESTVIVIGAGPAGLAVGASLQKINVPCIILEQNDQVGSAWHGHYDRLHLHTDKKNSELPFLPFPRNYPRYPSRDQIISYLESYAKRFQLNIQFHQPVRSAHYDDNRWNVRTPDQMFQAPNLVVATGRTRQSFMPTWPGQETFKGSLIHSSQYRNGEPFRGKKVLVVGFGNSGGEIALDLWEHGAQVSLSVRSAVNVIPREVFGLPVLSIGILESKLPLQLADIINAPILRLTMGDITKYGLRKLPYGPFTQILRDGHIPLIDIGTMSLIKKGQIQVYGGIQEFTEEGVVFENGTKVGFDALLLATGYRPGVDAFLTGNPSLYDENGIPRVSGAKADMPGLYFCGYYLAPTGMLREIGLEAKRIARAISGA